MSGQYYKYYRYVTLDKSTVKPEKVQAVAAAIGPELKKFIADKFGTQKKAAHLLGCSAAYLNSVIMGKKKLSGKYRLQLISMGLDESLFYNYISTKTGDTLQSKMVIYELKKLIDKQNSLLNFYQRAIIELRADFDKLRKG